MRIGEIQKRALVYTILQVYIKSVRLNGLSTIINIFSNSELVFYSRTTSIHLENSMVITIRASYSRAWKVKCLVGWTIFGLQSVKLWLKQRLEPSIIHLIILWHTYYIRWLLVHSRVYSLADCVTTRWCDDQLLSYSNSLRRCTYHLALGRILCILTCLSLS